jgi:hypothetical protein
MHKWFLRTFRQLVGAPLPTEELEKWPGWVPWLLGAVSVISWVFFVSGMSEAGNRAEAIIERSKPAAGEILEFTDNEARELREARVRYRIDGKEFENLVPVANRDLNLGDPVPLRYDPEDPDIIFEQGDRQPPGGDVSGMVGIAFVGGSICGLGGFFVWATQRKAARIRAARARKAADPTRAERN